MNREQTSLRPVVWLYSIQGLILAAVALLYSHVNGIALAAIGGTAFFGYSYWWGWRYGR